jgi:hypothetical protein
MGCTQILGTARPRGKRLLTEAGETLPEAGLRADEARRCYGMLARDPAQWPR